MSLESTKSRLLKTETKNSRSQSERTRKIAHFLSLRSADFRSILKHSISDVPMSQSLPLCAKIKADSCGYKDPPHLSMSPTRCSFDVHQKILSTSTSLPASRTPRNLYVVPTLFLEWHPLKYPFSDDSVLLRIVLPGAIHAAFTSFTGCTH